MQRNANRSLTCQLILRWDLSGSVVTPSTTPPQPHGRQFPHDRPQILSPRLNLELIPGVVAANATSRCSAAGWWSDLSDRDDVVFEVPKMENGKCGQAWISSFLYPYRLCFEHVYD